MQLNSLLTEHPAIMTIHTVANQLKEAAEFWEVSDDVAQPPSPHKLHAPMKVVIMPLRMTSRPDDYGGGR